MAWTIPAFVQYASKRLHPLGARVSVDVFGLAATRDLGIGQIPRRISRYVDAVYPMVYPSHYSAGEYNLADPNAAPGPDGRALAARLPDRARGPQGAADARGCRTSRSAARTRSRDVQAQIAGRARSRHAHGFLLWNAEGALRRGAALPSRLHDRVMHVCSRPARCAIVSAVAMTRTIELRTEIPGPALEGDPRAEGARRRRPALDLPAGRDRPRRSGATLTDVDGNTFIDFTGGVGCLNVGHSHPQVVAAAQEQLDALLAHRLHDRPVRGLRHARRAPAASSRRSPARRRRRSSTPAPRRSRTRSSSRARYTGRPAVIALRGRLPRPHAALADADLEDASVQGGARAVRARGLPRAVPERLPRPDRAPTRWRRSSARS